jgi:FkbM family methyltransferase
MYADKYFTAKIATKLYSMRNIYKVTKDRLIPITERSLIPKNLAIHEHSEFISDYIRSSHRYFEFDLLRFIRHRFDTSIFIDVGANIGNHCHYLKQFQSIGFAFEPEASNFDLLLRNVSPEFICHKIALSNLRSSENFISFKNSRGNGYLSSTFNNVVNEWGDGVDHQIVDVRTLDSFNILNCSFIKIDVEGSELKVLEGAVETITNSSPVVLIEIHTSEILHVSKFPYTRLQIDNYFDRIGYQHHLAIDQINHIYSKKTSRG